MTKVANYLDKDVSDVCSNRRQKHSLLKWIIEQTERDYQSDIPIFPQ